MLEIGIDAAAVFIKLLITKEMSVQFITPAKDLAHKVTAKMNQFQKKGLYM